MEASPVIRCVRNLFFFHIINLLVLHVSSHILVCITCGTLLHSAQLVYSALIYIQLSVLECEAVSFIRMFAPHLLKHTHLILVPKWELTTINHLY
jgi:hypothetical protein